MRSEAPLTVRWASIWAGDQYIVRYGGRLTTSPLSTTSTSMSRPAGARRARGSRSGAGSWPGRSVHAASSAASGVTQAQTEVAKDLPRNGPSGTYSQAWMSRADQSLRPTTPKTWSANASTAIRLAERRSRRRPRSRARPRCRAGGWARTSARPRSGALRWPHGRTTGVPLTTTVPRAAVVADRQVPPVRAAAAPGRGGRSGRRWRRGRARRRSRRSRRPRTAGAAVTSPSGSGAARCARGAPRREHLGDPAAGVGPRLGPERHEGVEAGVGRLRPARMRVADLATGARSSTASPIRTPDAGRRRRRREDAVRQVVEAEARAGRSGDPGGRHGHGRPSRPRPIRSSSGSLTLHEPNDVNQRRAPARSLAAGARRDQVVRRSGRRAPAATSATVGRRRRRAGREQHVEEAVVLEAGLVVAVAARRGGARPCT